MATWEAAMAQTAGQDRMFTQGMDLGFSISHSASEAYSEGSGKKRYRKGVKVQLINISPKPEEIFFL